MKKGTGYYLKSYIKNNVAVLIFELIIIVLLASICTVLLGGQPIWLGPVLALFAYLLAELRFMMAYVASAARKDAEAENEVADEMEAAPEESADEKPETVAPAIVTPTAEESVAEESAVEEPAVEEPAVEEPAVEEPEFAEPEEKKDDDFDDDNLDDDDFDLPVRSTLDLGDE